MKRELVNSKGVLILKNCNNLRIYFKVLEEVHVPGEDDFYREGSILPERANQLFNSRDYSALRKLFIRADYTFNTDSQWNKLESGFKNRFQQAGKRFCFLPITPVITP